MKKDSYYFPHDSNAKDDPKCVSLIEQLGLEGYGIFWVLVEILRDQPDYKYPLQLIPAIARRYNTTSEKVKATIGNYGLFDVAGDEFFYSRSLVERMLPLQEKKEQAKLAGLISAQKRREKMLQIESDINISSTTVQRPFNDRSTTVQPKDKIRGDKKRKEKIRKEEIINPAKHLFRNSPYFDFTIFKNSLDVKYHQYDLEYYHEVAKGYSESKGAMYKDWLAAIRNWLLRDINEGKARIIKGVNESDLIADRAARVQEVMNKLKEKEYGNTVDAGK